MNLQLLINPRFGRWLLVGGLSATIASNIGCVEGRQSTHELEHVVPDHWPLNMADAATKIEARLASVSAPRQDAARTELAEIISWLPEIAADTAMDESTWMPIYEACSRIEKRLAEPGSAAEVQAELQSLSGRLISLHQQFTPEMGQGAE